MEKKTYNKEFCINEALKYNTRTNFHKESKGVYEIARKNNWLDVVCSHMPEIIKPNNYWNFDRCQDEALKYNKRINFRKHSSGAYSAARLNGWLNQICSHMIRFSNPQGYWTKEKCHEMALKCNTRNELYLKYRTAYSAAYKKKWLDDICIHMIIIGNHYKRCIYAYEFSDNHVYIGLTHNMHKRNVERKSNERDQVTKYIKKTKLIPLIKQLTEYLSVNEASKLEKYYVEKYKNDDWIILNKVKAGGVGGNNGIWNYKKLVELALKYNKRSDFRNNNRGAYDAAQRNNWLNDICSHMIIVNKPKNYWTYELCKIEALKYKSRTEFRLHSRMAYETTLKNFWISDFL